MLRDEAVAIVKRRLAFYRGSDEDVISEMKLAQESLERGILAPHGGVFWPWFLLKHTVHEGVETGVVLAPSDFLHLYEWEPVWVRVGEERRELERVDRGKFGFGKGIPQRFDLVGGAIFLDPEPDRPVAIEMVYYGRDVVLDENVENLWLRFAAELLILETVRGMADALQMGASVRLAEARAAEIKRVLWATTMSRSLEEREVVLGGRE